MIACTEKEGQENMSIWEIRASVKAQRVELTGRLRGGNLWKKIEEKLTTIGKSVKGTLEGGGRAMPEGLGRRAE